MGHTIRSIGPFNPKEGFELETARVMEHGTGQNFVVNIAFERAYVSIVKTAFEWQEYRHRSHHNFRH